MTRRLQMGMSRETLDRLRLPIALGLGLMLLAGYMFIRRAEADTVLGPGASVVVGEPGGGVVSVVDTPPPATVIPTPTRAPLTPPPTPSLTPSPTPTPLAEEFEAEVMACRSIDGAECNDRITRLRPNDETFVALVLFDNAVRGDVMNAILDGPSGPIEGGAYSLTGSGRGYYYSTFPAANLAPGEYTLTAIRNGVPVATTEIEKMRGDDD